MKMSSSQCLARGPASHGPRAAPRRAPLPPFSPAEQPCGPRKLPLPGWRCPGALGRETLPRGPGWARVGGGHGLNNQPLGTWAVAPPPGLPMARSQPQDTHSPTCRASAALRAPRGEGVPRPFTHKLLLSLFSFRSRPAPRQL